MRLVRVCDLSELPPGSMKSLDVEDKKILVVNTGDGISALEGICTHAWADLSMGILSEDVITCPLHLSQFHAKTGEALTPPATEPLKTFNVKIDGSTLYVEID